jgi:flagellar motor component MotA
MNRDEFLTAYEKAAERAFNLVYKAETEGILSLEDDIDYEKMNERNIFEYGLRLIIDGTDANIIDKILSNIIVYENDEYTRILKKIQKEAILLIQQGYCNPRVIYMVLNSCTDLSLKEDKVKGIADEAQRALGRYFDEKSQNNGKNV